ncbi:terpenoid synthase [Aspergillus candidus]|uniref:Terpenoid synthase n=1 Tax=Aspergillus candidus TaxID=41067 RepID=A0A2I2FGU2_ASPCN|nr:terpenoid synthase [Aspergillus candidus]PLB39848.1 terpenoid synthase [Aspergillus candidus]
MKSIQVESAFSYHGLEINKANHTEVVKSLIRNFLDDVQFDRSLPFLKDHELDVATWTYFKSLNLGPRNERAVEKVLKLSSTLVQQSYTSLPFEIRVICTIQVVYMFLVDDIADDFMEELRCFGQNFVMNNGHKHPLLSRFDSHLRYLARYYGPYCHSTIIKSIFDYINGRIIEHEMEQTRFAFPADSSLMPVFLRGKVGAAEVLVALLWPKTLFPEDKYLMQYFPITQELITFIDFTNDILSYYKEFVIRDEKGNFVSNFAETHNMTYLDVLRHLTSYTPKVLMSVYKTLQDKETLLRPVQDFVNGWIMLCTAHRRYHLVELFADEGYLPPYDEDA